MQITRWLVFIIFVGSLQWYAFQAFRTISNLKIYSFIYWILSSLIIINFVYQTISLDRAVGFNYNFSISLGYFLALLLFDLIVIIFLFVEDIFRVVNYLALNIFGNEKTTIVAERRKFLSTLAIGVASIPFASLIIGMYKGKYNFKVLNYVLEFKDLPASFDGYKITQISDLHCGSLDNEKEISYCMKLINNQKSDIIVFTGDMVNNKANELDRWKSIISTLEAKDGKFSILGNHDYGDYVRWGSSEEKLENFNNLLKAQKEMGFNLLLNENYFLKKGTDRIALIGVENWGGGSFKKAGNLKKAIKNIESSDFKILLSHDPSHWEAQVLSHPYNFNLTLSGHTHGFQFGIEIPGLLKWSPAKWRYKQWAGIYKKQGQFINVNRGLGFLGYPGRVGIFPEISVITLKKA